MLRVIAIALLLGACSTPPVDSFCEKFKRFDFTDTGWRALKRANQEAVMVNDNTWLRDCQK